MPRRLRLTLTNGLCLLMIYSGLGACDDRRTDRAFFPIEHFGRWGVIDQSGKVVVEPQFDDASRAALLGGAYECIGQESVLLAGKEKWLYVTHDGIRSIDPPVRPDQGGVLLDNLGQSLFAVYTSADLIKKPVTPSVVLDPLGQWKPAEDIEIVGQFGEDLIPIYQGGKYGYADRRGAVVIKPQFDGVAYNGYLYGYNDRRFHEGLATVKVGDKWGYIDRTGKTAIEPQYLRATSFDDGFAIVFPVDDPAAPFVIDRVGTKVNDWFRVEGATHPIIRGSERSEGLAPVSDPDTKLYGFVDRYGNWRVPPIYHQARGFHDGLAPVVGYKEALPGYIDRQGLVVVHVPDAKDLFWFSRGLAYVRAAGHFGYIDRTGKWVWKIPETEIRERKRK